MNSLYGRLIQNIYERSHAQCSAAGGKKLYAADCHTSGCRSAAGNRGITQQSQHDRCLWIAMAFG